MSALASLVRAYDQLAERGEVPAFGYSVQKISFVISLNDDGTPAGKPSDVRNMDGRKPAPRPMRVPQPVKRTSGVSPNFLWDKTSYVLGVTAGEGRRLALEHAAFVEFHRKALNGTEDDGLAALQEFFDTWIPEKFAELDWPEDMKDQNVVFALERERRQDVMIHDRSAAQTLWARISAEGKKYESACLVTGERGPIARLHPSIKGVWGAQTAGASIVSFEGTAFRSYGNEQGRNAPTSERAAAAYTTMLNRYLAKGSKHRIQIGDASTVFWADASDADAAGTAEDIFAAFFAVDEEVESGKVRAILEKIVAGRPIPEIMPDLPKARFYVLGLSPNAARISVRFYLEGDFGEIARRYLKHIERMRIEPPPREAMPSMWRLLIETAVLRKSENIQPNLAGEWMRAILTGAPYPRSLLSSVIMRLRADHDVNGLRVAILKSVLLSHNPERKVPVSLDPDFADPGYLLGRLFATYEQVQSAALGQGVNATITDKFYGAASAQPRKVFHLLEKNSKPHLSKLGKAKPGYRITLEKQIGEIMEAMSPGDDPFPAQLATESQALFGLGYYHQRNRFFRGKDKPEAAVNQEDATE